MMELLVPWRVVLGVALDDAKGLDSKVPDAHFSHKVDGALEDSQQGVKRDPFLVGLDGGVSFVLITPGSPQ